MRVIAEINGWTKKMDAPDYALRSGQVVVQIEPPLDFMVPKKNIFPSTSSKVVQVVLLLVPDTRHDRLPVFRYMG
jgi:hypothetical protein